MYLFKTIKENPPLKYMQQQQQQNRNYNYKSPYLNNLNYKKKKIYKINKTIFFLIIQIKNENNILNTYIYRILN